MFKKTITLAVVALVLCLATTASAQVNGTWINTTTGDWSDGANWNTTGPAGMHADVDISTGGTCNLDYDTYTVDGLGTDYLDVYGGSTLNILPGAFLWRMDKTGLIGKKHGCFLQRQRQHFADVPALVVHAENFAAKTLPLAGLAGNFHVAQEVHAQALDPRAFAHFAAAALVVERKLPLAQPQFLGPPLGRVQRADVFKQPRVRGGVAARCAPDGCLVDSDQFPDGRITRRPGFFGRGDQLAQ